MPAPPPYKDRGEVNEPPPAPLPRWMYPKCGICVARGRKPGSGCHIFVPDGTFPAPHVPHPQGERSIIFKDPACGKVVPSTYTSTFPKVEGSKHRPLSPTFFNTKARWSTCWVEGRRSSFCPPLQERELLGENIGTSLLAGGKVFDFLTLLSSQHQVPRLKLTMYKSY